MSAHNGHFVPRRHTQTSFRASIRALLLASDLPARLRPSYYGVCVRSGQFVSVLHPGMASRILISPWELHILYRLCEGSEDPPLGTRNYVL